MTDYSFFTTSDYFLITNSATEHVEDQVLVIFVNAIVLFSLVLSFLCSYIARNFTIKHVQV